MISANNKVIGNVPCVPWKRHGTRLVYPLGAALVAVSCVNMIIVILPGNVSTRPWRGSTAGSL
jgi:hypothetical protein